MSLKLIEPPVGLPLSLTEAKAYARLEQADDDAFLAGLVRSATAQLDGADGLLGRALLEQTWEYRTDAFPGRYRALRLPLPPLLGVDEIRYVDPAGVEQVMTPADYAVFTGDPGAVAPVFATHWPATRAEPEAVITTFRCGYGPDWNDVPEPLRHAIGAMVAAQYDGCGGDMAMELVAQYRVRAL